jgi:hypothetical protein
MTLALLKLSKGKIDEIKKYERLLAKELGVEDDGCCYYGHVSDASIWCM